MESKESGRLKDGAGSEEELDPRKGNSVQVDEAVERRRNSVLPREGFFLDTHVGVILSPESSYPDASSPIPLPPSTTTITASSTAVLCRYYAGVSFTPISPLSPDSEPGLSTAGASPFPAGFTRRIPPEQELKEATKDGRPAEGSGEEEEAAAATTTVQEGFLQQPEKISLRAPDSKRSREDVWEAPLEERPFPKTPRPRKTFPIPSVCSALVRFCSSFDFRSSSRLSAFFPVCSTPPSCNSAHIPFHSSPTSGSTSAFAQCYSTSPSRSSSPHNPLYSTPDSESSSSRFFSAPVSSLWVGSESLPSTAGTLASPTDFAGPNTVEKLFMKAVKNGRLREVCKLLDAGADPNYTDEDEYTPLMWACSGVHRRVAALLLQNGADVNAARGNGCTALHAAAWKDRKGKCVAMLAHAGARVNCKDDEGWTPLHEAASMDRRATVRVLLASGASRTARNNLGHSPRYYACSAEVRSLLRR